MRFIKIANGFLISSFLCYSSIAFAENIDQLNKDTQNPVADLASVPFQSNWTFRVGQDKRAQYLLNIQPVIPISLNENWNIITRTVLPAISQPRIGALPAVSGMGDTYFTTFFSPISKSKFIWGVGPAFIIPTATQPALGSNCWGIGPSVVALVQADQWTVGILSNQVWPVGKHEGTNNYSQMLVQPFISYSLPKGWSLNFTSEVFASWVAPAGHKWTLPLDFVVSRIIILGTQPVSLGGGVRYFVKNAIGPAGWGMRIVVSFLFPIQ